MPETCDHDFDPERVRPRYDNSAVEASFPTDGVGDCDRRVGPDETYCIFHRTLDRKDAATVVEAFVSEVSTAAADADSEAVANNRFIGAKFPDCDLSNRTIRLENNRPIDLRFARIDGDLSCSQSVIENQLRLEGIVVEGDADFRRFRAGSTTDISGGIFRHEVDFGDSNFQDHIWAMETQFGAVTSFNRISVDGDLCLAGTTVDGNLRIVGSDIGGNACLSQIDCQGGVLFELNRVHEDVWCRDSTFRSQRNAGNLMSKSRISGSLRLMESAFNSKLSLENTQIDGKLLIEETTVEAEWMDFTNCEIQSGRISQPSAEDGTMDQQTKYDFTDATVGDVTVSADAGNGFEFFRFENTTFDGFDFGHHRQLLVESDWTIHTVHEEDVPKSGRIPSRIPLYDRALWFLSSLVITDPSRLAEYDENETTYLKAKNGANQTGDNRAAAEFFIKEMSFRRRRHAETALNGPESRRSGIWTRLRAVGAWVANFGLAVTTGYGEKPHRVLLAAGATIGLFAAFYLAVPDAHYTSEVGPVESVLFSFQSFVTFILGDTPVGDSLLLDFTSTIEGFIGAFLVALSVFALTRSVHR
jgi:hypothetical protein